MAGGAETELEAIVVRLLGDGSEYQKMLTDAVTETQHSAHQVEEAAHQIDGHSNSLKGFAHSALGALELLGAGEWFKEAFGAFGEFEKSTIRLTAAIESNGHAVEPLLARYKEFGKEVAEHSLVTKGATRSMLEQAEVMGFSGDAAERVVKNAIGLAKGNEELSRTYIRVTAALEQGNVQLLRRIPGLRGIKDESELVAKAQHLIASGLKVAEAETESSVGKIEHLKHSFHALFIDLGGAVATVFNPVVTGLKMAVDWFGSLDKVTKVVTLGLPALLLGLHGLGPTLAIVKTVITPVLMAFSGWGAVIGVAVGAIALLVNRLGGMTAVWNKIKEVGLAAWDYVKEKAGEFWEWFAPIADEIGQVGSAAWVAIKEAASAFWDWLKDVWEAIKTTAKETWDSIGLSASVNWSKIKSDVLLALWAIEFGFKNLKLTAQVAWTQIGIWTSQVIDLMTTAWNKYWSFVVGYWAALYAGALATWNNIKILFGGEGEWQDIGTRVAIAFSDAFENTMKRMGGEGESEYTKQLKKQYADLGGELRESFDAFRKRKEEELGKGGGVVPSEKEKKEGEKKWSDTGGILGGAFGKGVHEGMKKVDAALFGSSEALTHIQEYAASFNAPAKKTETQSAGGQKDPAAEAIEDASETQVAVLNKIATNTAMAANKGGGPSIVLATANLSGSIA